MHMDAIAHKSIRLRARARTLCLSPSHSTGMVCLPSGSEETHTTQLNTFHGDLGRWHKKRWWACIVNLEVDSRIRRGPFFTFEILTPPTLLAFYTMSPPPPGSQCEYIAGCSLECSIQASSSISLLSNRLKSREQLVYSTCPVSS